MELLSCNIELTHFILLVNAIYYNVHNNWCLWMNHMGKSFANSLKALLCKIYSSLFTDEFMVCLDVHQVNIVFISGLHNAAATVSYTLSEDFCLQYFYSKRERRKVFKCWETSGELLFSKIHMADIWHMYSSWQTASQEG